MTTLQKKHKKKQDSQQSQQQSEQESLKNNTQQNIDQNNQAIVFGSQPISIKCPFCLQRTKSEIIAKPQLISIIFGLLLFSLLPNAIMIVIVVLVLQITATKKHRCSLCQRQIGSDGKFLIYFKDEVYSFSLGETGILISKKILMTGGLFLFMLGILHVKANLSNDITWSQMTWRDLIEKCPIHRQNQVCRFQNDGYSIKNWKGYVMRIDDNRQSLKRFYEHAVSIYVKMIPSQNDENHPDILLTGSSSVVYNIIDTLDNLNHGDQIIFNATFTLMKRPQHVEHDRHFHIIDLNRTGIHQDNVKIYATEQQKIQLDGRIEGSGLRVQTDKTQENKNDQKIQS